MTTRARPARARPLRARIDAERRTVLHLDGVTKQYTRGSEVVHALSGVDLDIREREFVAVVGRSGSGKSTLLNVIAGFVRPDNGNVMVEGVDIAGAADREVAALRRRKIGFVFQFFHLLPTLSVEENVALPLVADRRPDALRAASAELERLGLGNRRDHRPHELSGGEMQRVAIARALVVRPSLVIADEPTGNLDSETGAVVVEALMSAVVTTGAGMLLVTHDDEVAALADRRLTMQDGRLC